MKKYERVPLRDFHHRRFYFDYKELEEIIHNIEILLSELKETNSIEFTKFLLKNQPNIGITPNINEAYNYILQTEEINKENLKKLFEIISLKETQKIDDTKYHYRTTREFMMKKSDICSMTSIGAMPEQIEMYMDKLFDYIDIEQKGIIENFIKSQIIHLYFVYIHPYSNINGRTSRTLAQWHLIKTQSYPFTVFDRVTAHTYKKYSKNIKSIYNHGNITNYLKYIFEEVQKEFERILIISDVNQKRLTKEEILLLENYLLLNNTDIDSLLRMITINTPHSNQKEIIETQIRPLIEKDIFKENEKEIKLNKDLIKRPEKVKKLNLEKYIR